jgi:transcriptional regulator with XRE-family HTH domain
MARFDDEYESEDGTGWVDKRNAPFAMHLRSFMDRHPDTGAKTTQKVLADYLDVRPQTVSYYCTGDSLPNCEQLLKIANFFNVTCDFLMTGKRLENKPARDLLGLSDNTVQKIKLIKEGYFENAPIMLAMLDVMLGDKDFYTAMEQAAEYAGMKQADMTDDYLQFLEWKSASYIQNYMIHFFAQNLESIHYQLKGLD